MRQALAGRSISNPDGGKEEPRHRPRHDEPEDIYRRQQSTFVELGRKRNLVRRYGYAVAPGDDRFLVSVTDGSEPDLIHVTTHWLDEVKERAPER